MRIALLGPVQVFSDTDDAIDVGGARQRMLLARLAVAAGRPVAGDTLVDDLWGEDAPAGAAGALQAVVSRLRKALQGAGAVELVAGGYRLVMADGDVDGVRFEELAGRGRRELAAGEAAAAAATLGAGLGLWRGPALADVLDAPFAQPVAARWEELRAGAEADRFEAEIRLGRHAEVLAELGRAGAERPLSERLVGLRMRALALAGRQADALLAYEELRGRLADELGVDPSAELREVHLALLRGELERSPERPDTPVPTRLPAQLTSFVGREAELKRLADAMRTSRLATIVGPGGAGKTRLALEAVTQDQADRAGRVWFVPLASVSGADQFADAVLGALGSTGGRLYDGKETRTATPVDRMAEVLEVGDALLVLDNCEHVVEAAAELADQLFDRLPRLRILATSREPLAITGESLLHLGPLEVPVGQPEPEEAAEAAAVRLFVDRAEGVRPGFVLDAGTVDAVVEICSRLDGMPLALELAAAKLRSMSVQQIARRLDDRFRLLTSGSRTALPRQRTLLAVVEWSWELLDEPERVLARRLSAFPGGATLAALEGICSDEALPRDDVLYVLGSLVEKSLVEASGEDDPRYRMLETVRAYAAARLAESGDGDALAERLTRHFLALVEENEPLLRTRDQLRAIALFDAEHDNLLSALRAAFDACEALVAYRFVKGLLWYWGNRGMNNRVETSLSELLRFGDALPERERSVVSVLRRTAGDAVGAQEIHPARLLWISQQAFSADGADIDAHGRIGERRFEQSLSAPDPWVRASANWAKNFMLTEQGDLRTGAEARRAALRGFEEVGDRWGLVMSLLAAGRGPSLRGEFDRSVAYFERAVAISSELGTEDYLYWTRTRLARERLRSGDLAGSLRDIDAIQRHAKERGHRRNEANILFSLAAVYRRAGDFAEAERTMVRMESVIHRLPYPEEMARDLIAGTRMMSWLVQGNAVEARSLISRALRPNFTRRQSNGLAWAAEQVGELAALEGDAVGAAVALGMSEAIRGAFDSGEHVLRLLVPKLVERLGEERYRAAYAEGSRLPRADAIDRLAGLAGQPVDG